ncbi:MAG: heparinase II/III family protein, partial [Promethearchaeota archaeon]
MNYLSSVADVVRKYPVKIQKLLSALDPSDPEIANVLKFMKQGDKIKACKELLNHHFTHVPRFIKAYNSISRERQEISTPEEILSNTFTINLVKYEVPTKNDGGLDWHCLGPQEDREWGWGLNRHGSLAILLNAWKSKKDVKYLKKANDLFQDWIISNPCPQKATNNAPWRHLEVALRLVFIWGLCFYEFPTNDVFTPATKLMMLFSIQEQAEYVQKYHQNRGNILVMELASLLVTATLFPKFKKSKPRRLDYSDNSWNPNYRQEISKSEGWVDHAICRLHDELLSTQVYPDGVQKELTQHYHHVVAYFAEIVLMAAKFLNIKAHPSLKIKIEMMWDYLTRIMRPSGKSLLNNDSDLDDWRKDILFWAKKYERADWVYICSNGTAGNLKSNKHHGGITYNQMSFLYPWAGHVIMRDGWKKKSHWSFFDIGPFGTGHQHRDRLHVSINALGHYWLVDSGRYWYKAGKLRDTYFQDTRGHNCVLFDGFGQREYEMESKKPLNSQFIS